MAKSKKFGTLKFAAMGGRARAKALTPERRSEIARMGSAARHQKDRLEAAGLVRGATFKVEGNKRIRMRLIHARVPQPTFLLLEERAKRNGHALVEEVAIILAQFATPWET